MTTLTTLQDSLTRLSPASRRLLWILAQGGGPVPESILELVFRGESAEEERVRRLGEMVADLGRISPAFLTAATGLPSDVRERFADLTARYAGQMAEVAPLVDELVAAGLARRSDAEPLIMVHLENGVASAVDGWMQAHPEEAPARSAREVKLALADRRAALFVAAVEGGGLPMSEEYALALGSEAVSVFLAEGAMKNLSVFLGDAVRVAKDASLVGPMVALVEWGGALAGVMESFRERGDGLGEAGTFAALSGRYEALGRLPAAIDSELSAIAALGGVINSVIPRAIVHLRVSRLLLAAGRLDEARLHHLAALLYRVLVGSPFSAEIEALTERRAAMGLSGYSLPKVEQIIAAGHFSDLTRFMEDRRVEPATLQSVIDTLVDGRV